MIYTKVSKVWRTVVLFLSSCRDALLVEEPMPRPIKRRRPMTALMVRNKRKKEKKRLMDNGPKTKRTQTDPRAEILWLQELMQSTRRKHKYRKGARLAQKLHFILLMAGLTFGLVNNVGIWVEVVGYFINYIE
ncbi:hypothetical protein AWZ03_013473 [Drosophila navojoa]|uniref:Uncharacterized protein n=1 Tax=Drosophila navojoa TaxID=7232 RepID=A0A484AUH1_DRONA|nr:hypothetical protein AWZ03_013473 [Drosophila navojoa]